jgi:hypothetical protein
MVSHMAKGEAYQTKVILFKESGLMEYRMGTERRNILTELYTRDCGRMGIDQVRGS